MATEILIGQVLQTTFPSQYGKWRNPLNPLQTLKPGAIRVRTRGSSTQASNEVWATPANPHYHQVPVYGEQVMLMTHADGGGSIFSQQKYYYISLLNSHGLLNNSRLPFLQDARVSGRSYLPSPISLTFPGIKPIQPTFMEKKVTTLQPFTGDIIHQDRFGCGMRYSSTHMILLPYKKKPFWKGVKPHDPIITLTCGIDDAMKGDPTSKHYAVEDPDKDKTWIYMTTSQKIEKFKTAQKKLGDGVDPFMTYLKPQLLGASDRIIFNAKKDEIVLVAKKDVKIATPKWQTDMDDFFTEVLKLIQEVIKQNKNLEDAHKEYGAIAQANATSIHPTPVGPSGPPLNAAAFVKSKGKSVKNATTTKSIRKRIEAIEKKIKKMKQ
jgi:hypothetical protein